MSLSLSLSLSLSFIHSLSPSLSLSLSFIHSLSLPLSLILSLFHPLSLPLFLTLFPSTSTLSLPFISRYAYLTPFISLTLTKLNKTKKNDKKIDHHMSQCFQIDLQMTPIHRDLFTRLTNGLPHHVIPFGILVRLSWQTVHLFTRMRVVNSASNNSRWPHLFLLKAVKNRASLERMWKKSIFCQPRFHSFPSAFFLVVNFFFFFLSLLILKLTMFFFFS
ncbi:unnamed protein product [Acanthosepion pharaonis]|uniref:Transmembrane protein n=1 Tax=Acanthosepion pharaonis TaxID=158019 RepID=A0A812E827_ACAPH|nr:unnamed protein product [Sepia pharaonis]